MLCRGLVAACQAATQNWQGMMALRFLMGVFEAGFGPGIPYLFRFSTAATSLVSGSVCFWRPPRWQTLLPAPLPTVSLRAMLRLPTGVSCS